MIGAKIYSSPHDKPPKTRHLNRPSYCNERSRRPWASFSRLSVGSISLVPKSSCAVARARCKAPSCLPSVPWPLCVPSQAPMFQVLKYLGGMWTSDSFSSPNWSLPNDFLQPCECHYHVRRGHPSISISSLGLCPQCQTPISNTD